MLGVMFVVRTVMAWQFQNVGATALFLADVFTIDYTQLGTLIGLYMLPGIIARQRLNFRRAAAYHGVAPAPMP